MSYQSKEKALKRMNEWFDNTFKKEEKSLKMAPLEVKVPIYKSSLRKSILSFLQYLFYKKAYRISPKGKKVSEIDFSRWIPPNSWKSFEIIDKNLLYIPELMEEYDFFWENGVVHSYAKEDLQYGFRPINLNVGLIGGGRGSGILLDKENGNIYDLGSGIYAYDYIKDFESYKKGKKTNLNWKDPPYLYKNEK